MTAKPRTEPDGAPLRRRLASLRRRLRLVASFRGLSWLLTAVLLTAVLVGLLDWRWHLPGLVRAFALVGLLTSAGLICYRQLLRPLATPADDLSLALRIEERYPVLNDSLASTVQFLQRETVPEGESTSMRHMAVRRTLGKAEDLDFNRVVDAHGLRTAGLCSLLSVGAALALAVLFPHLAATALARLANPFGPADWPRQTRLELERVASRIGRNREYRVRGTVRGVVPREVTAEMIHEGFPVQRKVFAVREGDDSFVMHLKPEEVQKSFRFRILANDAATPEYSVEVLPLPSLASLDGKPSPQVRLDYPAYTDLPSPHFLTPGTGNVEAVSGTVVTCRAAVDRPLRRAWVEYQPEVREAPPALFLAALGSDSALGVLASIALTRPLYERIEATLGSDRKSFTVRFRPGLHGMYTLHFEDENDLENSRNYELRLRPDPAPVVRLDRPSPTRDVLTVLSTAELPLQLVTEDLQFALRSVWIEYRTQPNEAPRVRRLYHHRTGHHPQIARWAGTGVLAAPVPRLRPQRLEFDRVLAMQSLRHADGRPLKEGDVVLLQACADDFDDVSPGKEPGRSHQVEIRIVGRDALDLAVNAEQTRVQQELVRQREKQREALAKVAEVEARLRKGGKLAPEREAAEAEAAAQKAQDEAAAEEEKAERAAGDAERERHRRRAEELKAKAKEETAKAQELKKQATQLAEAEQLQQQIRERIGDHNEGLRAEVDRLRQTLRQNGMERSNAMDRMTKVAKELDRLAERELETIEPKLTNARKLADLLDEKTRQERQAELEKQAKQAESDARAAEAEARKFEEQAAKAEQAAASAEAEEKAHKEQEAKSLREQAAAQKAKAAEKLAQAERDRRDAKEKPDPTRPRQALSEARRGQEEVEKSLNALLQELEPWSSTAEIKGEAGRILQDQKDLQDRAEQLGKDLTGKSPDELTPNEKADLESLQDAQRRLQERTAELIKKMERVAQKREQKGDEQTARELSEAANQAEEGRLVEQMKEAGERIKQNQLNQAQQKQREAVAQLEKLTKNLEDRREAELDRLRKKLREIEQEVEKLLDEQERLQKKIREANKIADPKKREEELERLSKKQDQLKVKTEEAMQQLSRLGAERARQSLGKAAEEMDDAVSQLRRNKGDNEKQEDVLDRLEEARRELERARKKADEELGREQLARVADVIKRIRDRQQGHGEEARRIQDVVLQQKGWKRAHLGSLRQLADAQAGLGEETTTVVKKDLTRAPVFARLLGRAARAMQQASQRAADMVREKPGPEALPDEELAAQQKAALRRLEQLLASLKESQDAPAPLSGGQGGGEGRDDGGGGGGGDDGLPPMAQLKLLKALQTEVYERTEAFRKKHPDPTKLTAKEKAELAEIVREQKEVADLLDQLSRPPGEGDDPDDKPMEQDGKKSAQNKKGDPKAPDEGDKP
jgi:hypothetical protein